MRSAIFCYSAAWPRLYGNVRPGTESFTERSIANRATGRRELPLLTWNSEALQRRTLRPILLAWSVVALLVAVLALWDTLAVTRASPLDRFLRRSVPGASQAWRDAARAQALVPAGSRVLVRTDRGPYSFYCMRYLLYPTWAIVADEIRFWTSASADSFDYALTYEDGDLRVERIGAP